MWPETTTPPPESDPKGRKRSARRQDSGGGAIHDIRTYWDAHIHDAAISAHPVGTEGFFTDLEEYRFDKLRYLEREADFSAYRGKQVLEIGCGAGIDLACFARNGASVTGIDLSQSAIGLAGKRFAFEKLDADLRVMDGERMDFADASFDLVYGHGVLQYTAHPEKMMSEILRVLRPGAQAFLQVYNSWSWLHALSKVMKVELEHADAPVLRLYSPPAFKRLVRGFSRVRIVAERFPVKSRLHKGVKAFFYNTLFVRVFNWIPRAWVRPIGWHLIAKAVK